MASSVIISYIFPGCFEIIKKIVLFAYNKWLFLD
jgi:hypothetical protein